MTRMLIHHNLFSFTNAAKNNRLTFFITISADAQIDLIRTSLSIVSSSNTENGIWRGLFDMAPILRSSMNSPDCYCSLYNSTTTTT